MSGPARVLAVLVLGLGTATAVGLLASLDPQAPIGLFFVLLIVGVALALIFFIDFIARNARDVFRRLEDEQKQNDHWT
jgi:hypothetical protein